MRAKVLDEKVSGSPNLSSKKLETQKRLAPPQILLQIPFTRQHHDSQKFTFSTFSIQSRYNAKLIRRQFAYN